MYASNIDLPETVRFVLPEHAKSTFREMFNYALTQSMDEEKAIRVAWAAVSRRYVRRPDGNWVQRSDWA